MIQFRYRQFRYTQIVLCFLFLLFAGCNDDLIPETSGQDDNYSVGNTPIAPPIQDKVIPGMQRAPVIGHMRGLALLISFNGQFHEILSTQAQYDELFNGDIINPMTDASVLNLSSVKRYFSDQSNGKLALTHEVTPILKLSRPRSAYPTVDSYVTEAIEILNRDYPNFLADRKHLFNNNTLRIDDVDYPVIQVLSIMIGGGSGIPGDQFYPHAGYFTTVGSTPNSSVPKALSIGHGLYLSEYQLTPELRIVSGRQHTIATLGVLCHELGHAVTRFRDYYDSRTAGLGYHCLMSTAQFQICPPPLNPYLKWLVGWAEFKPLPNSAADITIKPNENNTYYVHVNPRNPQEMYILENRFKQKNTWTEKLVSEGLAIWHVDNTVEGNLGYYNWVPNSEKHYEIAFVQAGLKYDPYKALTWNWGSMTTNQGNRDDCFGSTEDLSEFSHETIPAANWWSGAPSGMILSNIKLNKTTGDISFHYDKLEVPDDQTVTITEVPKSVLEGQNSISITVATTNIADGEILKLTPPNDTWKGKLTGMVKSNKAVFELISPPYDLLRNSTKDINNMIILWGTKIFDCAIPHKLTLEENNPPLVITVTPSSSTISNATQAVTLSVSVKNMIDNESENSYQIPSTSKLRVATDRQSLTADGTLSYTVFGLKGAGTITSIELVYGQNANINGIQYHETRVTLPLSTPITVAF